MLKIQRWLVADDIAIHGTRWQWWAIGWGDSEEQSPITVTATIEAGTVELIDDAGDRWVEAFFDVGDYFTPIKGEK